MKSNNDGWLGRFFVILFFVFLILKLTKTISWSWWWVFSPLIIDGILLIGSLLLIGIGTFAQKIIKKKEKKEND